MLGICGWEVYNTNTSADMFVSVVLTSVRTRVFRFDKRSKKVNKSYLHIDACVRVWAKYIAAKYVSVHCLNLCMLYVWTTLKSMRSVVSLKGILSDKVVLKWKGTVNTFVDKKKRVYSKRDTIRQTRNREARYSSRSKDKCNAVLTRYIVSPHDWEGMRDIPLQHLLLSKFS